MIAWSNNKLYVNEINERVNDYKKLSKVEPTFLEFFDKRVSKAVAMGNAPEEIKRKADYVTLSNDDDGIAHFLDEFIK